MGDVWHAYKKDTNEAYAIKIVEKAAAATNAERVVEEKEILASMDNPFVIRMHWAFQDDSCVYLVLEHAVGGDLDSVMRNFHLGGMSEDRTRFYIAEILLALEYLHEMGIIVRDLKPANCLTTASGHVKLADFGHSTRQSDTGQSSPRSICKSLDRINQEPASDTCSDGTGCVGTPEYMAPETLLDQSTTKLVDYWSLGIIMYELIFACSPWGDYEGSDCVDLFYSIITQPVCFPDEEVGDTSSDDGEVQPGRCSKRASAAATDLIVGLLEKDPANRPGGFEVKAHVFFNLPGSELDWAAARRGELVPPIRELPYRKLQRHGSPSPLDAEAPARGSPIWFLRHKPS
jgi:protein-serine/threonine kinase